MSEKRDEYFPISEGHAVIAQRILKELLDTRSFQKYLIDSTVNEIFGDSVCVPVPLLELNSSRKCSKVESSVRRHLCIRKNVGILIQQLALIKDLFATSSNLAFCHVGANSNHDAALLFSTRLHLQRFINSFHFELQKFEQTIRRFDTLFRLFAIRLSTPFQIANYAFFATSLCDLLYNFEEFCSIREKLFSKEFIPLRKAIDSFHNVVVLSLNKMIKEKVKKEYSSKKTPQVQMPLQRSPNKSKLPATFRQVQETLRSPGYLLPQKLDRRRQVVSTRFVRNDSGVAKRSAPTHESAKNIEDRRVQHLARGITEKVMDEIVRYVCGSRDFGRRK